MIAMMAATVTPGAILALRRWVAPIGRCSAAAQPQQLQRAAAARLPMKAAMRAV